MNDEELKQLLESHLYRYEIRTTAVVAEVRQYFDVKVAEMERKFETFTADIKHLFVVENESNRHQIQLIAEQFLSLHEKLDRYAERLDDTRHGVDDHERRIRVLEDHARRN